jgi:hypothetical protein
LNRVRDDFEIVAYSCVRTLRANALPSEAQTDLVPYAPAPTLDRLAG